MLVLTRKVGEAISIGDDVKVVVMQIKGKQVRLGVKAQATTAIHREEVYQKIQEENRIAARTQPKPVVDRALAAFKFENKPDKGFVFRKKDHKSN